MEVVNKGVYILITWQSADSQDNFRPNSQTVTVIKVW